MSNVEQIFQRQRWLYEMSGGNTLITSFEDVTMAIRVDGEDEIVYLLVPVAPGKGMSGYRPAQPATAEHHIGTFLSAVNYILELGALTRDCVGGEIRFEATIPVPGTFLSDEQLVLAIVVAVGVYTRFTPIIEKLLYEQMPLDEALADLDSNYTPPLSG